MTYTSQQIYEMAVNVVGKEKARELEIIIESKAQVEVQRIESVITSAIAVSKTELKADIAEAKADTLKWMVGLLLVLILPLYALIIFNMYHR